MCSRFAFLWLRVELRQMLHFSRRTYTKRLNLRKLFKAAARNMTGIIVVRIIDLILELYKM